MYAQVEKLKANKSKAVAKAVTQKQGKTESKMQNKDSLYINNEIRLEKESDVTGSKALQIARLSNNKTGSNNYTRANSSRFTQNIIQGNFLDKKDKKDSFERAETAENLWRWPLEMWAMSSIKVAIVNYETTEGPKGIIKVDAAKKAIQELIGVIRAQKPWAERFTSVIDQLEKEAEIICSDFEYCENFLKKDDSWKNNPNEINKARKEVTSRLLKYGGKETVNKPDSAINRGVVQALNDLKGAISRAGYTLRQKIGEDQYEYGEVEQQLGVKGDTIEVEVNARDQQLLEGFRAIQDFFKNKTRVLNNLAPLGEKIKEFTEGGTPIIEAFSEALRCFEMPAGFDKAPVVPLGILPADVFIRLLSEGNILDDFGAGLQHGEYSHRLQWIAIIQEFNSGNMINTPVIDLYKAINLPPFSENRTGNSMWGMSMDKGTSAVDQTYSAPGTLNKDLMKMAPNFNDKTTIGKATWKDNMPIPSKDDLGSDTYQKLQAIGEALNAVKEARLQLAEGSTDKELGTNEWIGYGAPTKSMVEKYEQELTKKGYLELDSGEFIETNPFSSDNTEKKAWKVLRKP